VASALQARERVGHASDGTFRIESLTVAIEAPEAYRRYAGRAPRDRPAERADKRDSDSAQRARVRDHPAVGRHPALAEVLATTAIRTTDVPARLAALDVVIKLPLVPVVERAVLSAQQRRRPHARRRHESRAPRPRAVGTL
jgi:hypothetical protein